MLTTSQARNNFFDTCNANLPVQTKKMTFTPFYTFWCSRRAEENMTILQPGAGCSYVVQLKRQISQI